MAPLLATANATIANVFRCGAALAGSSGANLDPRIHAATNIRIFPKQHANAFTNQDLEPYLREQGINKLWVVGVFAEGCVRTTALAARRLGFDVVVPEAEIATNARWKGALASGVLRSGDVTVVPTLRGATRAT